MTRALFAALLVTALIAGTIADTATPPVQKTMGAYQVLAGDFHVHTFPFTWSTLAPWDVVVEAGRRGLDVIAITPHDEVWTSKVGRWFSQRYGGPIVLTGEEVTTPAFHMLAIGIEDRIEPVTPAATVIEAIHRQDGVAVAAHPYPQFSSAFDNALATLDGSEVVRPEALQSEEAAEKLRTFFGRAHLTAFGNSDYHGLGTIGYARTYVFAKERTAASVLEALRAGRTVTYGRDRAYGDAAMLDLVARNGGLRHELPPWPLPGFLQAFSRFGGLVGLVGVLLSVHTEGRRRTETRS